MTLKKREIYEPATRALGRDVIYEPELIRLLTAGAIEQLQISPIEGGYTVRVLARKRLDAVPAGTDSNVVRLRPVRMDTEGFVPLYAVRTRELRIYRSLDTFIRNLRRFGKLPLTVIS